MTLARRVDALDAGLSPTQLVVRWLDEVHAFGDLEGAVDALLAEEDPEPPFDRLTREAVDGTFARLRGKPTTVVGDEVRRVLRETVFRFELVLRINVTVHERLQQETLIYAAMSANLALLVSDDRAARRADTAHLPRLIALRDTLLGRVDELLVLEAARSAAECHYLHGHPALFPDAIAAWAATVQQTKELAVLAMRLAELDGRRSR